MRFGEWFEFRGLEFEEWGMEFGVWGLSVRWWGSGVRIQGFGVGRHGLWRFLGVMYSDSCSANNHYERGRVVSQKHPCALPNQMRVDVLNPVFRTTLPWCIRYKGTSPIRGSAPLGPYSRTVPRARWKSWGGGSFLQARYPRST